MENTNTTAVLATAKENFTLALTDARSLDIVNNVAAAFDTAVIVNRLEACLTPEVMQAVFMPLMNKKIGFKTDRDPSKLDKRTGKYPVPYSEAVVRTCIIDAAANGLLPTGNQFNIISGTMYPTKEGYTALLTKLKSTMGLVYSFEFDPETTVKSADPSYVAIPCRISYKTNRDDLKGWFKYTAMVKSNGETSSTDQLRGKAERKCKKAFFEFLTGLDLGDGDADTVDVPYKEVSSAPAEAPKSSIEKAHDRSREVLAKIKNKYANKTEQPEAPAETEQRKYAKDDITTEEIPHTEVSSNPDDTMQPNLDFDEQRQQALDHEADLFFGNEEGGVQ